MGFVDDDGVVSEEVAVLLGLGEEHAVGHQLQRVQRRAVIAEADFAADAGRGADLRADLFGDASGDCAGGDAAGLGVGDLAAFAEAELKADEGELGCFAGAGFAADDGDLVIFDEGGDFVAALGDGEVGIEVGGGTE